MPPLRTGALSLETLRAETGTTIAQFGVDRILEVVNAELAAHNDRMRDMVGALAEISGEPEKVVGQSAAGKMREVDDFARVSTQVGRAADVLGFPAKKYQYAVGWTRDFELRNTPADMAIELQNAQIAHRIKVMDRIRSAIFTPTNYTFVDTMGRREHIGRPFYVKALANGDGMAIAMARNGTTFGPTHTHYLYATALTEAAADAVVSTVVEHDLTGNVVIQINEANAAAWRALPLFTPLMLPGAAYPAPGQPAQVLDLNASDNRQIGFYNGRPVFTRSWIPVGYTLVQDLGAGVERPLRCREVFPGSLNLRLEGEIDIHPLRSQYLSSYFGFGVQNRVNGAILYVDPGAVAYVAPTFNS